MEALELIFTLGHNSVCYTPWPHCGALIICVGFLAPVVTGGGRSSLESPSSSELNEEEESPEPDADYIEEYDSEEERKQKRKKRLPQKIRASIGGSNSLVSSTLITRSTKGTENDKPFLCNCKSVIL